MTNTFLAGDDSFDYDELCLINDCVFRDLPQPRNEEEEMSGEPWFHYGPHDVFPEQWLPFLCIPAQLQEVFLKHHAEVLTASWWRAQQAHSVEGHRFMLPTRRETPAA